MQLVQGMVDIAIYVEMTLTKAARKSGINNNESDCQFSVIDNKQLHDRMLRDI